MSSQWPVSEQGLLPPGPDVVQIGISIEPGVEIIQKESSKLGAREDFAKRVGMDLFRYESHYEGEGEGEGKGEGLPCLMSRHVLLLWIKG